MAYYIVNYSLRNEEYKNVDLDERGGWLECFSCKGKVESVEYEKRSIPILVDSLFQRGKMSK